MINKNYETKYEDNKKILLDVKNINFSYSKNKLTLKNISFNIKKGSFHGLIGSNGAGKSTLIKLLIKALNLKSGSISINGIDYASKKNDPIIVSYFPDSR